MNQNILKPKLIVNCGSMFSGKSTALISQGQRYSLAGHKTVFLKPSIDVRWSIDEVVTHNHFGVPAIRVGANESICDIEEVALADVVLIDEIQFFNMDEIMTDIEALLWFGKVVIVSGLDLDSNGKPFEITMQLMAKAETVNKFNAVCGHCGDNAWVSAKKTDDESRIQVGGAETYVPLCRTCFEKFKQQKAGSEGEWQ